MNPVTSVGFGRAGPPAEALRPYAPLAIAVGNRQATLGGAA